MEYFLGQDAFAIAVMQMQARQFYNFLGTGQTYTQFPGNMSGINAASWTQVRLTVRWQPYKALKYILDSLTAS